MPRTTAKRPFKTIAVVLLSLLALLQLTRIALGWAVTVNGFAVPIWASVVALLVAATLALMLYRES